MEDFVIECETGNAIISPLPVLSAPASIRTTIRLSRMMDGASVMEHHIGLGKEREYVSFSVPFNAPLKYFCCVSAIDDEGGNSTPK